MTAHLIVSTVVLALAITAARVLPLTARTRHAILLAGLAKFALPSEPFARLLRLMQIDDALPMQLRILGGGPPAPATTTGIDWLTIAWASVAILIAGRWLLLRTRTISAAMRTAQPPAERDLEALRSINVHADIVRSPIAEAPAVLRIVRPVIVLANTDTLDDDELRALLLHECAHIRRRDNLVSMLVTFAGAALWFHPLVWLAMRDLAVAREQACDEVVAESTRDANVYLDALTKVCRAAITPRVATASCMASPNLEERIEHLMNYDRLKESAFPHRIAIVTALLLIVSLTTLTAAGTASDTKAKRYAASFSISRSGDLHVIDGEVIERATGTVVTRVGLHAKPNEWVKAVSGTSSPDREVRIRARVESDERGVFEIEVYENGRLAETSTMHLEPKPASAARFTGEPISIMVRQAKLTDVLKTFGDLTGLKMEIAPEVDGFVTVDLKDVPWDQALDLIARQNGLTLRIENKTIHVSK